jgi:hypothetical protein
VTQSCRTPRQRFRDAQRRMRAFEKKYARSKEHPHLPLVVDMVEYMPDRRDYEQAARDLFTAARELKL